MTQYIENYKPFFVSIFGVVSIKVLEFVKSIDPILTFVLQGLIGVLTIIYLIVKIRKQLKE